MEVSKRRLGSKGPCDIPYKKKSIKPPKFLQKAPCKTFLIRDCKNPCDQHHIATMVSPPLAVHPWQSEVNYNFATNITK
jgi:hypothetical protein